MWDGGNGQLRFAAKFNHSCQRPFGPNFSPPSKRFSVRSASATLSRACFAWCAHALTETLGQNAGAPGAQRRRPRGAHFLPPKPPPPLELEPPWVQPFAWYPAQGDLSCPSLHDQESSPKKVLAHLCNNGCAAPARRATPRRRASCSFRRVRSIARNRGGDRRSPTPTPGCDQLRRVAVALDLRREQSSG